MGSASDAALTTSPQPEAAAKKPDFKLVGFSTFVRSNPHTDLFPVLGFHHVEFWSSDAISAAGRFSFSLGAPIVAFSGLATSNPFHSSNLICTGDLRLLFSSPLPPVPNINPQISPKSSIPSFDRDQCVKFVADHGLAARAIAIRVADAAEAFQIAVRHGARAAFPPVDLGLGFSLSEIELYGDVVLRLISHPSNPELPFLPGFDPVEQSAPPLDYGIRRLDHAVGNVPDLASAAAYVSGFTGFHEFAEFTADDVGTAESGLNSVVLADNEERVLIPMNEPVSGTKRRSQIQTYLDYNGGAGVQHLALSTEDVFGTLREMRRRTAAGGFDFMPPPPPTYYRNLERRAGDVLTAEQIKECEELGILVDRDDQGVLLQIFTKPVGDRPTIFLEIIQRVGCMVQDSEGKQYQKGGCGGFGKGNFSELFKSIEEYEKSLEGKQP